MTNLCDLIYTFSYCQLFSKDSSPLNNCRHYVYLDGVLDVAVGGGRGHRLRVAREDRGVGGRLLPRPRPRPRARHHAVREEDVGARVVRRERGQRSACGEKYLTPRAKNIWSSNHLLKCGMLAAPRLV